MTFSEGFAITLKVPTVFGLVPFQFNRKTKQFELSFPKLAQSIFSYLLISLCTLVFTALFRYGDAEMNLRKTANVTIFSEDVILVTVYNIAMMNWFHIRKDHVDFLNKLNQMGEHLKIKLKINELTPSTYYKRGVFAQTAIIVFCVFLVANEILRDILNKNFKWSTCTQTLAFGTEVTAHVLLVFYIGYLAVALGQYFNVIFIHISNIKSVRDLQYQELLICIKLFDELISLKMNFSKLFGHQFLLIFLFDFVYSTIGIYFIITYSVETNFSASSIYVFCIFVIPQTLMFVCLIHFMHKLGDVVSINRIIKIQFNFDTNKCIPIG